MERHFGPADWKVADPLPVICLAAALLLVLLPIGWVTNRQTDGSFGEQVQPLVQYLGSGLGCVLLLIVALSAAGRISREKERRTLGPLLVLPVSRWDILFTKWLGSLLSVRGPLLVLAALWGLGCVAGALDVFAVLLLAAAWGVCAGFLASLGLWLSAVCGSTLRANLLTFLAALVFAASPLRAAGVFLIDTPQGMPVEYEWVDSFLEHLLNPGGILGTFSFRAADLVSVAKGDGTLLSIWTALAALYVYLAAIPVLWLATLARLDAGEGAADGRKSEGAVASDPRASV